MTRTLAIATLAVTFLAATPHAMQFGSLGKALGKANDAHQAFVFTDADEAQVGSQISEMLRDKYGVVQDQAVHKYVTLVGTVLAQASSRPNLKWTFIVLDTPGVNAFAAPGGYVHITRGALSLLTNEAELADVLGHEISHVTNKDTIRAIQKSKRLDLVGQAAHSDLISQAADQGFQILLQNGYDRSDELNADHAGVILANSVGYSPKGLGEFLTRLADRNKGLKDPSGLFASHPDTVARLDALTKTIADEHLAATATVAARFTQTITYKPVMVDDISKPGAGAPQAPAAASNSGGGLGLGGLSAIGREKSSSSTISSAGSRGVNPDRDAPGGPVKTLVAVTVTPAEIAAFKKGITG